jgi:hypothetical protein
MSSVYDIDFNYLRSAFLPSFLRGSLRPLREALITTLLAPLKRIHSWFFGDYADGFTGSKWDAVTVFVSGDKCRYTDGAVYLCILTAPAGTLPTDTTYFRKIQDNWIGANERVLYNGQKLTLEWALNKWFETEFRQPDDVALPTPSDIYITEETPTTFRFVIRDGGSSSPIRDDDSALFSQYFIRDGNLVNNGVTRKIWFPDSGTSPLPGWWTAFNADGYGENRVRMFVDKYNIAGVLYLIDTY